MSESCSFLPCADEVLSSPLAYLQPRAINNGVSVHMAQPRLANKLGLCQRSQTVSGLWRLNFRLAIYCLCILGVSFFQVKVLEVPGKRDNQSCLLKLPPRHGAGGTCETLPTPIAESCL